MERKIELTEVRAGDSVRREWMIGKVKWTSEARVTKVHADKGILDIDGGAPWCDGLRNYTYYLVNRPVPQLPTERPAVVKATEVRGVKGEWWLTLKNGGYWLSYEPIDGIYYHERKHITEWRPVDFVVRES